MVVNPEVCICLCLTDMHVLFVAMLAVPPCIASVTIMKKRVCVPYEDSAFYLGKAGNCAFRSVLAPFVQDWDVHMMISHALILALWLVNDKTFSESLQLGLGVGVNPGKLM